MNPNDIDKLFEAVKSDNPEKAKKLSESAAENLNPQQKEMLNKALTDNDFLQTLLCSPKAKELLRHLGKKGE